MYRLLLLSFLIVSCSKQKEAHLEEDVKPSSVTTTTEDIKALRDAKEAEVLNETLLSQLRDSSKKGVYNPPGNFRMPVQKPDSSVKYTILIKKLKAG